VAASGGYWLLCTGDTAYANRSSLVGSIGVISTQLAVGKWLTNSNIKRTHITTNEDFLMSKLDPLR
jgi:ClpP class serine protease